MILREHIFDFTGWIFKGTGIVRYSSQVMLKLLSADIQRLHVFIPLEETTQHTLVNHLDAMYDDDFKRSHNLITNQLKSLIN